MRYIYEHLKDTPVEIEYPADLEKIVNEGLQKPLIYNRYQKIAHCPYCGYTFNYIDKLRKGDTTYCPHCYTKVVAMPHTCLPISSYDSYVWMFYRNDTIYFVVAEAGWRYSGQAKTEKIKTEKELEEARAEIEKLNMAASSGEIITAFRINVKSMQTIFNECLGQLAKMDENTSSKFKKALTEILTSELEALNE